MCKPKAEGGLGFRDMEGFNIALLARQGWRIIQEPGSLLARLLRARYYPSSTFLNARVGHCPSYTWRSLLRGRDILERGSVWMVGNGSCIDLEHDNWIPKFPGVKPTTSTNLASEAPVLVRN